MKILQSETRAQPFENCCCVQLETVFQWVTTHTIRLRWATRIIFSPRKHCMVALYYTRLDQLLFFFFVFFCIQWKVKFVPHAAWTRYRNTYIAYKYKNTQSTAQFFFHNHILWVRERTKQDGIEKQKSKVTFFIFHRMIVAYIIPTSNSISYAQTWNAARLTYEYKWNKKPVSVIEIEKGQEKKTSTPLFVRRWAFNKYYRFNWNATSCRSHGTFYNKSSNKDSKLLVTLIHMSTTK